MPPTRGTDRQTFRLSAEEWAAFDRTAAAMGKDRATYLRDFIRWANRVPGAKMPARPARPSGEPDQVHKPAAADLPAPWQDPEPRPGSVSGMPGKPAR